MRKITINYSTLLTQLIVSKFVKLEEVIPVNNIKQELC